MRSPVQIWLAAPKKNRNRLVSVLFCLQRLDLNHFNAAPRWGVAATSSKTGCNNNLCRRRKCRESLLLRQKEKDTERCPDSFSRGSLRTCETDCRIIWSMFCQPKQTFRKPFCVIDFHINQIAYFLVAMAVCSVRQDPALIRQIQVFNFL